LSTQSATLLSEVRTTLPNSSGSCAVDGAHQQVAAAVVSQHDGALLVGADGDGPFQRLLQEIGELQRVVEAAGHGDDGPQLGRAVDAGVRGQRPEGR